MKFLTTLFTLSTLLILALAGGSDPGMTKCTSTIEGKMRCKDPGSWGSDTLLVCQDEKWHVVEKCAHNVNCFDYPVPHCFN